MIKKHLKSHLKDSTVKRNLPNLHLSKDTKRQENHLRRKLSLVGVFPSADRLIVVLIASKTFTILDDIHSQKVEVSKVGTSVMRREVLIVQV